MSPTESELGGDGQESVVDGCPLAMVALDADQRVQVWNPAAERLAGRAVEEVVDRRLDEVGVIPPEQRGRVETAHRDVVAGHRDLVCVEIECCHRDGSRVTANMWGGPLRGRDGQRRGMVAVLEVTVEQWRHQQECH